MNKDQRQPSPAEPQTQEQTLTDLQRLGLRRVEGFGWDLRFVRREHLPTPLPVVADPSGRQLAVLDEDGRLNLHHGLRFRP